MSLQNVYYKRTAATAKACYICYKPSTTVLATVDTTDFLYTCPVHLTDPGFATRVKDHDNDDTKKLSASAEEIARVKQEWEEKQKRMREKQKQKQKEEKRKEDDKQKVPEESSTSDKKPEAPGAGQPTVSPRPTHERYVLHRHIFNLRLAEHRKRRQAAQAKTLAPRLPGIPSSTMS
ncbi:VPS4-associated protein 1 [Pisolithus orientalis]|uniref:VPS4-associated protein 1 n=1 Tax=Pisolithus orientalis TaxID=936130 RepID=UPI002225791D|nr:VPS4-associated protein 1 [Pisolithus orientalis]KAI6035501.1 VPS4-associated protein 1 [Pisolithus orientalis]